MERGGRSGWKASQVWVELWSTHCLAITPNKVHMPNIDRVNRHPLKPLRHVVLGHLKWQPSETHVRGGCSRCCRPRHLRLPSRPRHCARGQPHRKLLQRGCYPAIDRDDLRSSRKTRQAGAQKHRQMFLSCLVGTPVHSSGTRLTLTLGGGAQGTPPPGDRAIPFPSASIYSASKGIGGARGRSN